MPGGSDVAAVRRAMDDVAGRAQAAIDGRAPVHERKPTTAERGKVLARRAARRLPPGVKRRIRMTVARAAAIAGAPPDAGGLTVPEHVQLRADADARRWALAALDSAVEELEATGSVDPVTVADLRGAIASLGAAEELHRRDLDAS
jgi:hypothetical protein